MPTPEHEDLHSHLPVMPDGGIYYPYDDVSMNWWLAESIRALIKRTLDPEPAERLSVKLELLFEQHGVYKPADWPD